MAAFAAELFIQVAKLNDIPKFAVQGSGNNATPFTKTKHTKSEFLHKSKSFRRAAVHRQHHAGDKLRRRAAQVYRRPADVFRFAEPI